MLWGIFLVGVVFAGCQVNEYRDLNDGVCHLCPSGSISPVNSTGIDTCECDIANGWAGTRPTCCIECPNNTYSDWNSRLCLPCPQNAISSLRSTVCHCAPGYWNVNKSEALDCQQIVTDISAGITVSTAHIVGIVFVTLIGVLFLFSVFVQPFLYSTFRTRQHEDYIKIDPPENKGLADILTHAYDVECHSFFRKCRCMSIPSGCIVIFQVLMILLPFANIFLDTYVVARDTIDEPIEMVGCEVDGSAASLDICKECNEFTPLMRVHGIRDSMLVVLIVFGVLCSVFLSYALLAEHLMRNVALKLLAYGIIVKHLRGKAPKTCCEGEGKGDQRRKDTEPSISMDPQKARAMKRNQHLRSFATVSPIIMLTAFVLLVCMAYIPPTHIPLSCPESSGLAKSDVHAIAEQDSFVVFRDIIVRILPFLGCFSVIWRNMTSKYADLGSAYLAEMNVNFEVVRYKIEAYRLARYVCCRPAILIAIGKWTRLDTQTLVTSLREKGYIEKLELPQTKRGTWVEMTTPDVSPTLGSRKSYGQTPSSESKDLSPGIESTERQAHEVSPLIDPVNTPSPDEIPPPLLDPLQEEETRD